MLINYQQSHKIAYQRSSNNRVRDTDNKKTPPPRARTVTRKNPTEVIAAIKVLPNMKVEETNLGEELVGKLDRSNGFFHQLLLEYLFIVFKFFKGKINDIFFSFRENPSIKALAEEKGVTR